MDIHYDNDTNNVSVAFELPGLQKEEVSINVHNNVLTVSGENKASSERNEGGYVVRERRYGKFTRSMSLPQGLKVSPINMLFNNGNSYELDAERRYQSIDGKWGFDNRLPEVNSRYRTKEGHYCLRVHAV